VKLLIDQNLSPKLSKLLHKRFPDSKHIRFTGLNDASDIEIFKYARTNGFAVLTFDSDFMDLNLLHGTPPKIIWLKTGNLITKAVSKLIENHTLGIINFLRSDEREIFEIYE